MSSGDEDSKDQQVCQTSKWLHFSLQSGGTATHYSHDKGTPKATSFHARQCGQQGGIHENECVRPVRTGAEADCAPLADRTYFGATILLTQSVWIIFDR
jgi:hypothetical protein